MTQQERNLISSAIEMLKVALGVPQGQAPLPQEQAEALGEAVDAPLAADAQHVKAEGLVEEPVNTSPFPRRGVRI